MQGEAMSEHLSKLAGESFIDFIQEFQYVLRLQDPSWFRKFYLLKEVSTLGCSRVPYCLGHHLTKALVDLDVTKFEIFVVKYVLVVNHKINKPLRDFPM
jgi:alkylhydroperoxidase/carboxymuconolactone decarboxylase family protein YurZ